ncbi:MAG: hypothetical protein ACTSW3_04065 [Promethearchaeota archaeon]
MFQSIYDLKNYLDPLFHEKKHVDMARTLANYFKTTGKNNIQEFGDLIVELAKKDMDFFIEKLYPAIQIQMKKLPINEKFDVEKYIINNYCLYPREKIIETFTGRIIDSHKILKGIIFLTNYRIIASGDVEYKKSMAPGLIGTVLDVKKFAMNRAITIYIQKKLNEEIAEKNILTYGYVYPINNIFSIYKSKKAVNYKFYLEYERKGKFEKKLFIVSITPNKDKKNPQLQQNIITKIEEFLKKNL